MKSIKIIPDVFSGEKSLVVCVQVENEHFLSNRCRVVWIIYAILKSEVKILKAKLEYVECPRNHLFIGIEIEYAEHLVIKETLPVKRVAVGQGDVIDIP
jgi:hypothetical protein